MSRSLKFTYATLVIGKDQTDDSYNLTGRYTYGEEYERAFVEFDVVVQNDNQVTFLASEAALVAAYSQPDQAFECELATTQRHAYDVSDNTALYIRPSLRKVGDPSNDSAKSARYRCKVEAQLPADLTGRAGRLNSSVNVQTFANGRRLVGISGTYTALTSNNAREQFEASIAAYVSSIQTDLGITTWELLGQPSEQHDDQNKIITFTRQYRELGFNQSGANLDEPSLVDDNLVIRRREKTADASVDFVQAPEAFDELSISYSVTVRQSAGATWTLSDLRDVYETTVLNYLTSLIDTLAGGGGIIITDLSDSYDLPNSRIFVEGAALAFGSSSYIQARLEVSDRWDYGVNLKPVWDGNPFSRDYYEGPATGVKTVNRYTLGAARADPHPIPPQFPGYIEVRSARSDRQFQMGVPGFRQRMQAHRTTYTYVRADVTSTSSVGPQRLRDRLGIN